MNKKLSRQNKQIVQAFRKPHASLKGLWNGMYDQLIINANLQTFNFV